MPPHRIQIRPIYADLDAMDIVYYANYLRYFEQGRTELMRATGHPYSQVEADGFSFPVTEADIRYRNPARYDQLLYLDTWLAWMKKASLRFEYHLLRPEQDGSTTTLVTGFTVHGCVSHQGKVSALPKWVSSSLANFITV